MATERKTLKIFFSESAHGISMKFYKDVLWVTLCQIPLTCVDPLKNMAVCGQGILAIYSANFENPFSMKFYRDVF